MSIVLIVDIPADARYASPASPNCRNCLSQLPGSHVLLARAVSNLRGLTRSSYICHSPPLPLLSSGRCSQKAFAATTTLKLYALFSSIDLHNLQPAFAVKSATMQLPLHREVFGTTCLSAQPCTARLGPRCGRLSGVRQQHAAVSLLDASTKTQPQPQPPESGEAVKAAVTPQVPL